MKRLITSCLMLAAFLSVNAQSGAGHGKWEENTSNKKSKTEVQEPNEFTGTEISVVHATATFSDLPELSKPIWAVVTNPNGEVVAQKRITPASNYISLSRLARGEMYFVTLAYKNKSQKAFVVHL